MENIIEYIRLREWIVISETNQRKAISILTLSGGDINKLKELIYELSDDESTEISWYLGLLNETTSYKRKTA